MASRAALSDAAQSVRALSPGACRPRGSRPDLVAAGLWRFAGLGGAHASAHAEPGPHRFAGGAAGANRRRGAPGAETALSRFLPGRLRPSRIRAGCSRAATSMAMTRSATICWCSTTPRATGGALTGRRWSAPIGCCASRWPRNMAASTPPANSTSAPLIARHGNLQFLELGRSCVLAPYRNKRTVELLWHGIARLHVAEPLRRDVRLRQPRRHRSQAARAAAVVPASLCTRARSIGARARCPSAMSR